MSRTKALEKVKLTSFDDLFGGREAENAAETGDVKEIPLSELHEFHNHPFQIRSDEELAEMIESVREHGVLVPGIVRKRKEGGYEIISGHTRKHVCEVLGFETMPVFVKEMDNDEASVVMVDSNIQRENIRPSEKAEAYKAGDAKGKVVVMGSSSVGPVMEKLAEAYQKTNKNITVEVQVSDSTTGINSATEGVCDIGMASRELKDEETEKGVKATEIAKDGIAVIVNNDNDLEELSSDQVKSIFTGDITDWEDVTK